MNCLSRTAVNVLWLGLVLGLLVGQSNTAEAVSSGQVLKDFARDKQTPANRKILSTKYLGKPRNFTQVEGVIPVSYVGYQVEEVHLFTDCGTKVRYVWEVWYRNGRTYSTVATWSSQQIFQPPAPPPLDEKTATELITSKLEKSPSGGGSGTKMLSLSITGQKTGWNFCDQKFEVESKVTLTSGDEYRAKHNKYECRMVADIWRKEGKLQANSVDCLDAANNNRKMGCYYPNPNHCQSLGEVSVAPAMAWGPEAEKAVADRLREVIGAYTQTVDSMSVLREGPQGEKFGSPSKAFTVKFQVEKEEINQNTKPGRQFRVKGRYECKAQVTLSQRHTGTGWVFSGGDVGACPISGDLPATCDSNINQHIELWKICNCLGPEDHCAAAAANSSGSSGGGQSPPSSPPSSAPSRPSIPIPDVPKLW